MGEIVFEPHVDYNRSYMTIGHAARHFKIDETQLMLAVLLGQVPKKLAMRIGGEVFISASAGKKEMASATADAMSVLATLIETDITKTSYDELSGAATLDDAAAKLQISKSHIYWYGRHEKFKRFFFKVAGKRHVNLRGFTLAMKHGIDLGG